jgi:hypothetical protein
VYASSTSNTGANALYVARVTDSWTDASTGWNSQPGTTSTHQVSVPASSSQKQDYNIDVTELLNDMLSSNNYGFGVRLQLENPYASVSFASSEHATALLRPALEVTYTSGTLGTLLSLGADKCKDVFVDQNRPLEDLSMRDEIDAYTWTVSGTNVSARTYIKFDWSALPSTATIQSAKLYLYSHPSPVYASPTSNSGANALYVQQVTSSWTDASTNWDNQPGTSSTNQVSVSASTSQKQDYVIDVTLLVKAIQNNNNGFLIRLQSETPYASVSFAASEYATASMRPKLEIYYQPGTGTKSVATVRPDISVYPNPSNDGIQIGHSEKIEEIRVTDIGGKLIYSSTEDVNHLSRAELGNAGIYLLHVRTASGSSTSKFVLQ